MNYQEALTKIDELRALKLAKKDAISKLEMEIVELDLQLREIRQNMPEPPTSEPKKIAPQKQLEDLQELMSRIAKEGLTPELLSKAKELGVKV